MGKKNGQVIQMEIKTFQTFFLLFLADIRLRQNTPQITIFPIAFLCLFLMY